MDEKIKKTEEEYGIAIFSKYPIINKAKINFKSEAKNGSIFVDLKIDDTSGQSRDTISQIFELHEKTSQIFYLGSAHDH